MLSGYSDFDYLKSAIQLGVKDYLLKPVARAELNELLGKLAEEIRQEQQKLQASRQALLQKNEQLRLLQENFFAANGQGRVVQLGGDQGTAAAAPADPADGG
ncbi:hypothetical protein [Paenibacillus rhizoplanae]|uniref:hypothetical protein n=1 Tax=Paenibacillus rhizoplanae TaxID=1917181 RepID=UPI00361C6247